MSPVEGERVTLRRTGCAAVYAKDHYA